MIGQIIPLDPGARWPDRVEDAALSLLLRRRIVFLRGAIQDTVAGDIAAQLLALFVEQPMTAQPFQAIEHHGRRRQFGRTSFGVQRQARHPVLLHLSAHLPLQQGL